VCKVQGVGNDPARTCSGRPHAGRREKKDRGVVVTEAGSYLRLTDTQLKAHGPSRTCNEGKEEGE